jgi:hypothetical protein
MCNWTGKDKILIVQRYKQPHIKIEVKVWKKFFALFEGKFLTGRDSNGHHHLWGNSKNCISGNNLFHCITKMETNITLLNDCCQTYIFNTTQSMAAITLTFVNPRSGLLYSWKVGTDPRNSDYFPISIKYTKKWQRKRNNKDTETGLPLWGKLKSLSHIFRLAWVKSTSLMICFLCNSCY